MASALCKFDNMCFDRRVARFCKHSSSTAIPHAFQGIAFHSLVFKDKFDGNNSGRIFQGMIFLDNMVVGIH